MGDIGFTHRPKFSQVQSTLTPIFRIAIFCMLANGSYSRARYSRRTAHSANYSLTFAAHDILAATIRRLQQINKYITTVLELGQL